MSIIPKGRETGESNGKGPILSCKEKAAVVVFNKTYINNMLKETRDER